MFDAIDGADHALDPSRVEQAADADHAITGKGVDVGVADERPCLVVHGSLLACQMKVNSRRGVRTTMASISSSENPLRRISGTTLRNIWR